MTSFRCFLTSSSFDQCVLLKDSRVSLGKRRVGGRQRLVVPLYISWCGKISPDRVTVTVSVIFRFSEECETWTWLEPVGAIVELPTFMSFDGVWSRVMIKLSGTSYLTTFSQISLWKRLPSSSYASFEIGGRDVVALLFEKFMSR